MIRPILTPQQRRVLEYVATNGPLTRRTPDPHHANMTVGQHSPHALWAARTIDGVESGSSRPAVSTGPGALPSPPGPA